MNFYLPAPPGTFSLRTVEDPYGWPTGYDRETAVALCLETGADETLQTVSCVTAGGCFAEAFEDAKGVVSEGTSTQKWRTAEEWLLDVRQRKALRGVPSPAARLRLAVKALESLVGGDPGSGVFDEKTRWSLLLDSFDQIADEIDPLKP